MDFARSRTHSLRLAVIVAAALAAASVASGATVVIAVAPPDGTGTPGLFSSPANAGPYTAFRRDAPAVGPSAIVRVGPGSATTTIAAAGQAAPVGPGTFFGFGDPRVNAVGQVGFVGVLQGSGVTEANNGGVYRGDGASLVQLARTGANAPVAGGSANGQYVAFYELALNDAGQAAFYADLVGTTSGDDDTGLFRSDGATQVALAREDGAAPGGGFFRGFNDPSLDVAGRAIFYASISATAGGVTDGHGLFRSDGTTRTAIARAGAAAPGGAGEVFQVIDDAATSRAGHAAFQAFVGAADGSTSRAALFRSDAATGAPIEIADGTTRVDNRAGRLNASFAPSSVNDLGQVAVFANFVADAAPSTVVGGVFRVDDASVTAAAVQGELAPDGNGRIGFGSSGDGDAAINALGQLAFLATLTDTAGGDADDRAIYFYDEALGLVTVAREGGSLLGGTIVELGFDAGVGQFGLFGATRDGLNDAGDVAYRFTLADGRSGVAVWSVPEPTTLLASLAGVFGLLRRPRR